MIVAVAIANFIAGLFSRRWAGVLKLAIGIVLAYAGLKFSPFVFVQEADSGKHAYALGRVVGGLAVGISIVLLMGLVPLTLCRSFARWKARI